MDTIKITVSKQIINSLHDAVMELDIVTCQEGMCEEEPRHWTIEEVASIIVAEYVTAYRHLISKRPVHHKIASRILPRKGVRLLG